MGINDVHWAAAEVLLALSCPSPAPRLMPCSSPDQRAPPPPAGIHGFSLSLARCIWTDFALHIIALFAHWKRAGLPRCG